MITRAVKIFQNVSSIILRNRLQSTQYSLVILVAIVQTKKLTENYKYCKAYGVIIKTIVNNIISFIFHL